MLILDACAEAGIRVPEDLAVLDVVFKRETGLSMAEWRLGNRDAHDE